MNSCNKVNISRIANDLGVSVSTVSRALSGSGRISETTRQKILEYISDKELVPNTREKRYTDIVTKMISVVLPGEDNFAKMPYFQSVLLSVYDYFSIRGYQVNLIKITPTDISNLVEAVEHHVMDGVVLTRTVENNDEILFLKKKGVPFVVIGPYDDPDILRVDTDNEQACFDMTNALLHKGLNRIAIMCAEREHNVNRIRMEGILRAHTQNHMYLDRKFVFYDTESPIIAEMAIEKILQAGMDCILCMDDNICIEVMRLLRKMNKNIPEDIRIASLHNSELLEEYDPSVSCIKADDMELGKEAGRLLYIYLNEHKMLPHSMLGYELQIKDSTN